jgi:murein DD-endopeptidase MepM/ murein hydrolase activator NlpD
MAKSFYTFIVVPNASSSLHKVRVPVQIVYVLAAIGLISLIVAIGLGFSYAKMAFRVADYHRLEAENTDLKIQQKNFEVTTRKLNTKLTALETISEKLSSLIESDPKKRNVKLSSVAGLGGVGGSKVNYSTADLIRHNDSKIGVDLLKDRTSELEDQFRMLERFAEQQQLMKRAMPAIWPLQGRVTSHYGSRLDPFNGDREMHFGLDIAGLYGSAVVTPGDGVVIYAQRKAAYGNLIIINHADGITTRHGHLSRYNVRVGQTVRRGDVIGFVGNTGRTTAPHLHYEVRSNDRPVNPRNYLPRG